MIRRLLVANRGEIAVRIIATASVLGIETVAVYSADDATCAHVARADEAAPLAGKGASAYLDIDAILAAAKDTDCDAVHPGYGFLSERADFAARCLSDGLRFVGPSPAALALFGSKTAALERAAELGVPVLPATAATNDPEQALDAARSLLRAHGAVMVKAVMGGGGRGIRPVRDEADLAEAVRRCSSEAAAAFGDGSVYAERLLPRARHIEVQLLGDGHGGDAGVAVLGDRDCSIQRRRQKLIEIAPAPIGAGLRQQLHAAARALIGSQPYCGLATVEFLVSEQSPHGFAFVEVNPRLQVEHTVTEQVTGLDLVELALRVADGQRLTNLPLAQPTAGSPVAVQARVNAESLRPDGSLLPASGKLVRFQPPSGRGVRVDTHAYAGYEVNPRFDSLLAKVVADGASLGEAVRRAGRALAEFDVAPLATNIAVLQAILRSDELAHDDPTAALETLSTHTCWVDENIATLAAAQPGPTTEAAAAGLPDWPDEASGAVSARPDEASGAVSELPPGLRAVRAPLPGTVGAIAVQPGELVTGGSELVVIEAMKMEHEVVADRPALVRSIAVTTGDTVATGATLLVVSDRVEDDSRAPESDATPLEHIRDDLAEVARRHHMGSDAGRPEVVERRHAAGSRTARENVDAVLDEGSFVEYGALTVAAQRQRRSLDDLIARTPADGIVLGAGTVEGAPVAVLAYDYTVLAGTQGVMSHRKTDRLLELCERERLPLVMFVEGGGGRPGDTDTTAVAQLDVPTFELAARLSGAVPLVAVVSGYCFAGNAALAGVADVIIATETASLGMGGPAMIEGGGLGVVAPADVGPMSVQVPNGVVDVLVPDERAAAAAARRYLGYFTGRRESLDPPADQRALRHAVPANRLRGYDVGPVIDALCDAGSVLELRPGFGVGIVTALARVDGRAVGLLANNPRHLGGAIDGDAADKATAFMRLCQAHRLPVVSLVDTPGFMVGPAAEQTATVRRFGALFVAGAALDVPIIAIVLRKAYGLGAIAMCGGHLRRPALTVSWPSGEFGGMGLEGAVRLGFRKELDAIADPDARLSRYDELVAEYYEKGKALSAAVAFEIDDVIDPADTRRLLAATLARATV